MLLSELSCVGKQPVWVFRYFDLFKSISFELCFIGSVCWASRSTDKNESIQPNRFAYESPFSRGIQWWSVAQFKCKFQLLLSPNRSTDTVFIFGAILVNNNNDDDNNLGNKQSHKMNLTATNNMPSKLSRLHATCVEYGVCLRRIRQQITTHSSPLRYAPAWHFNLSHSSMHAWVCVRARSLARQQSLE